MKPPTTTPLPEYQKQLWDVDSAAFDQTSSVNVGAVYFSVAAFLPLLTAGNEKATISQSGQVVITSSTGSFGRVPMTHFAYSASKAAVTHMAKQMSTAFTRHKIRFNVIASGLYPSGMTESIVKSSEQLTPEEYALRISPLGSAGNTEDIVGCILCLVSKAGSWLSGVIIVTDGGKLGILPSGY